MNWLDYQWTFIWTWPVWRWLLLGLVVVGLCFWAGRTLLNEFWADRREEDNARTEYQEETEGREAGEDDPSTAPGRPGGAGSSRPEDTAYPSAPVAAGRPGGRIRPGQHQLDTWRRSGRWEGGETATEEAERLLARLAELDKTLQAELAADVRQWDWILSSGYYASTPWLDKAAA